MFFKKETEKEIDPRVEKAVKTVPVKTEEIILDKDEQEFFVENAGELNYLLKIIYDNNGRNGSAARLTMYAFRMGRDFERNNNDRA